MPAQDVLKRKAGVIVGDDVLSVSHFFRAEFSSGGDGLLTQVQLFKYTQEHTFAIPAIVCNLS
jgi:hypothetical protein